MNAKILQSPVRDAFIQTVRRVPAQQAYNGDSLRRVVLQRNAIKATVDTHEHRTPRRTLLESPAVVGERAASQTKERSRYTSRVQHTAESMPAVEYDVEAEDQWFDGLFEELSLHESTNTSIPNDPYPHDPFYVPEAAMPERLHT